MIWKEALLLFSLHTPRIVVFVKRNSIDVVVVGAYLHKWNRLLQQQNSWHIYFLKRKKNCVWRRMLLLFYWQMVPYYKLKWGKMKYFFCILHSSNHATACACVKEREREREQKCLHNISQLQKMFFFTYFSTNVQYEGEKETDEDAFL